ncbi:hypothetical protein H5T88_00135 [bacterium]|nr:hypothetical protein [bacterium]
MRLVALWGIIFLTALSFPNPQNNLILEGDQLELLWEAQVGSIKNAHVEYQGIFFSASNLSIEKNKIIMQNAYLTTCELPHPHYRISAKYLSYPIVGTKRKVTVKGASLLLGDTKIFSLPTLRFSLNPKDRLEEGALELPRISYSKTTGLSLSTTFSLPFREDTTKVKIGYLQKMGLSGKASIPLTPSIYLNLSRYEEITGKRTSPIFISESPHLLFQRKGFSYSFGRFSEEPTNKHATRLRLSLSQPVLEKSLSENTSLKISLNSFCSFYSDDSRYRSVGGEISIGRETRSNKTILSLGYQALGGSTPFLFDKEELPSYARLSLSRDMGNWKFEMDWVEDLKEGKLYDLFISLYKKLHCLEPGISWQKRGNIIKLQMKLVGFEM